MPKIKLSREWVGFSLRAHRHLPRTVCIYMSENLDIMIVVSTSYICPNFNVASPLESRNDVFFIYVRISRLYV